MNFQLIRKLIENPSEDTINEFFHDRTVSFYVDWKEFDDDIPCLCERVIQTGKLSGELKESPNIFTDRLDFAHKVYLERKKLGKKWWQFWK